MKAAGRFVFAAILALPLQAWAAPREPPSSNYAYYERPHALAPVARKFGLTIEEIAQLNGIRDPALFHAYGLLLPDVPSTKSLPRYVPWVPARARTMCASTEWKLAPAKASGCAEAFCGHGPRGSYGCACKNDAGDVAFVYDVGPRKVRLPIDISGFNPWGSDSITVTSIDLDGDGTMETIVSWLTAVSNGLGEEFRTFSVMKGPIEYLRFDSGSLTAKTGLVRVDGACHLASAHFERVTHPLRGPALYLVERTFDPVSFRMDPEVVGERVSEQTRFVLPYDPISHGPSAGKKTLSEQGSVIRVKKHARGNLSAVEFRSQADTSWLAVDPNPSDMRFGDAATARVYPAGFVWQGFSERPAVRTRFERNRVEVLWLRAKSP